VLTIVKAIGSIRVGKDVEGCRGPQAVACRKRCVRNLGGLTDSSIKRGRITEPEVVKEPKVCGESDQLIVL